MPTVTEDVTVFQRLVSEIYKQNWPPPDGACNASSEVPQNKTTNARRSWNENEQSKPSKEKIQRPFSATLISPRRGKGSRLMSANQSSSKIKDAKGLNAATFQNRRKGATKVPEYDSNRVLSEGAAARNKALAAEYLAMLSGRNYLKKHYREQYWVNEALSRGRPQTVAAPSIQRRYAKLYPDLGSVIGGKVPYVAGTTAKPTSPPRLEAWRLTSNTAAAAAANSDDAAPSLSSRVRHASEEEKVVVPELGLTIQAKKSWSNIPSGRCYRVLSHPNDTLASLCLEGRSAPSRANNSRTSSVSSALSMPGISDLRYALSSAGESTPSGSSDAMSGSRAGSGHDDLTESSVFTPNNDGSISKSAHESEGEPSVVCGIPDSVFKGVDEPDEPDSENRDAEYDEILEDNAIEDGDFTTGLIEDGVGRLSFSDLEESDISENEADDYDEGTVDENEANRRLQQVSAVFETTKDVGFSATSDCQVAIIVDPVSDGDFYSGKNVSDEERPNAAPSDPSSKRYEFAEFLPQPYRDCDLKSFANLSPGIDWRNFIQTDSRNSPDSVKRNNKKENLDRRKTERLNKERKAAKRKNVESIVDRLIMLEKLQAISVQYEQDRKRHIMHRAKARHAAKISSHNQSSTSSANTNAAVPQKETETRPQSARVIRRRSSTVSLNPSTSNPKPRRPLPSSDSKADLLVNKSSPDLDLVRLSCTKNHLQYIRRNSASPRKKQRQGLFLPR